MNKQTQNTVYLLIGQRGSGKSHYANRLKEQQSKLVLISRDDILVKLFGKTDLDGYSGGHVHARDEVFQEIRRVFSGDEKKMILLDYWTGFSNERWSLVRKLQQLGAERVVALCLTTPLELIQQWFWLKPGIAKMSEMKTRGGEKDIAFYSDTAPAQDFKMFQQEVSDVDTNGFDEVIRIDPLGELIILT